MDEHTAYTRGWLRAAAPGGRASEAVTLVADVHDRGCLTHVRDVLGGGDVVLGEDDTVRLTVPAPDGDGAAQLSWPLLRGYFERAGNIADRDVYCMPECILLTDDLVTPDAVASLCGIPFQRLHDPDRLSFVGANCIDFLGALYEGCRRCRSSAVHNRFVQWLAPSGPWQVAMPLCTFVPVCSDAVVPRKAHASDVGYDLSVIAPVKRLTDDTHLYDTGLRAVVSHGFYLEIVPRSSMSKTGYTLANGVGIVDPGYAGNLLVALTRGPHAQDVVFPFKCCQLIVRSQIHVTVEVSSAAPATTRGGGGFGSTSGVHEKKSQ